MKRFLKFSNYDLENINTGYISKYLNSLEADGKVKDWQVKQAADAVLLYAEKYLKKSLDQITESSGKTSIDQKESLQWKQTLEEVKNAIRKKPSEIKNPLDGL